MYIDKHFLPGSHAILASDRSSQWIFHSPISDESDWSLHYKYVPNLSINPSIADNRPSCLILSPSERPHTHQTNIPTYEMQKTSTTHPDTLLDLCEGHNHIWQTCLYPTCRHPSDDPFRPIHSCGQLHKLFLHQSHEYHTNKQLQ